MQRTQSKALLRRGSTAKIAITLALAIAAFALVLGEAPASGDQATISNQVLLDTAGGQETSFVIYLREQADLSGAYSIRDEDARGRYVYERLTENAARTQAPIRELLDARGVQYTPYWAANMIVAEGDRADVDAVAGRSAVSAIESDAAADGIQDDEVAEDVDQGNEVAAVEAGVNNVQGPGLWSLGFTGQGMVIANQDTGMRWTHASLRTHYRGWSGSLATADHNYNWHDSIHARITTSDGGTGSGPSNSCGYNLVVPCDDQGHGTHTTGTTAGDDVGAGAGTGTNQIGVAAGAKWIGCRNMDAGNGRAATYSECFQFFLAPTNLANANADPTKRPHVMNNSWGCPLAGELCPRTVLQTIVENSEAAGIFVVASAGNDGPNCSTAQDPPGIYNSAFTVGAISGTTNALQGFSSRGPVTSDGSGRMKPDLVAPGASVRSSLRNNDTAYGNMSGTSMAAPHAVGVVALLWSSRPNLVRDIARTKYLLTRSTSSGVTVGNNAAGCGGIASKPNNHFGWGRINALAAYNMEPSLNQTITFPAIGNRVYRDADFALDATASSGRPVSYSASGNCTVAGGTVHITGAGACSVTASQAGLDTYSIAADAPIPFYPAANVTRTFSIARADQTIAFGALADRTFGVDDGDFGVAATATSDLPVSFGAAGPCVLVADIVHITGVGDCTITASQSGDANFNAAPDVSRTFRTAWPFAGFFDPIGAGMNLKQGGSTVPVKFSLGGDRGMAILAGGSPGSQQINCSTSAPIGDVEPGETPGNSSLTFGGDRYHVNWKTEREWGGTCRQLVVVLADNTEHRAFFRFK